MSLDEYRSAVDSNGCVYIAVGVTLFWNLEHSSFYFLSTNISQGNVVTRLMCGGIFNYCVVRHLLLSLHVKEF